MSDTAELILSSSGLKISYVHVRETLTVGQIRLKLPTLPPLQRRKFYPFLLFSCLVAPVGTAQSARKEREKFPMRLIFVKKSRAQKKKNFGPSGIADFPRRLVGMENVQIDHFG